MQPRTFVFCSFVLLSAVVLLCVLAENRGLSSHYSAATKASFRLTLSQPFGSSSIAEAFAGVSALLQLGEKVADKDKSSFCSAAWAELSIDSIAKGQNALQLSTLYYANQIRLKLACPSSSQKASKAAVDLLLSSVEEAASVSNVFYASTTLLSLHAAKLLPDQPKFAPSDLSTVITQVAEAFASEISIESYGHGLSAVAAVVAASPALSDSHSTEIDLVADAIGDALGRGVELDDGSVVFYDAGDSSTAARVTAALLSGIAKFAAIKSDLDLPSDLSSTVGDYFVSRAPPTSVSDIHHLLTIIDVISGVQLSNPMALTVSQRSLSSGSKEDLIVTLSDIWGAPLNGGSVYLVGATREGGSSLITNQPLAAGTAGQFRLNLLSAKPDAGLYELEFSATAPTNSKFSGITSTTRKVQITIPITVSDVEFQLVDSGDNEVAVKRTITENSKLEGDLEGLYAYNIVVSLSLRAQNAKSSKSLIVQQVFVSLTNTESGHQVVFPAQSTGKGYTATIELRNDGRALNFQSGLYNIRLFVADTFIENPVNRDLGNIKLTFASSLAITPATKAYSSKLPDIQHTFRIPEKRPDPAFSLLFTAITLAPVLYLAIAILSVGFNLSGIPSDPLGLVGTLVLIGAVAATAFLYFEFFMSLNIFETLSYLGPIALVALVAGKYALRSRAANTLSKSKKE